jgi:hypothetical protein
VRLQTEADLPTLSALAPDYVVIATGGIATTAFPMAYYSQAVPGWDLPSVVTHEAAVSSPESLGRRIVVADLVGHVEGIGIAELLAGTGRTVVLSMPFAAPPHLDGETAGQALGRAVRAGATWRPQTLIDSIAPDEVRLTDLLSGTVSTIEADSVVVRTHGRSSDALYHEAKAAGMTVVRAGDAVAPRTADRAIFDGHMAGRRA